MCGFVGFHSTSLSSDQRKNILGQMTTAIQHRGPDDEGHWFDEKVPLAIGHRRLSIIDLSPLGHQPMESHTGRYVIAYNGEVYNFGDLKKMLEPERIPFKGKSDTEVILAAIETWGLQKAVSQFVGMFAFALWDKKERRLHLVRDRMGIKPLYYGQSGESFFFGSELKSFKPHPQFKRDIDREAVGLYLRFAYIPAPHSIYSSIKKVAPGQILSFEVTDKQVKNVGEEFFWPIKEKIDQSRQEQFAGSDEEATHALEKILSDSVKKRMISDVRLGTFLSGGIDSSLVTALMQANSSQSIKTFSIGFDEDNYNEAKHAKAIAQHLGTEHTEEYVSPEKARSVIPKIPFYYDEPFADSSQIPTYLVSEMTRKHVTVSLSGDGGDELFSGYNRYFWGQKVLNVINRTPSLALGLQNLLVSALSPQSWDRLLKTFGFLLSKDLKGELSGQRLHRVSDLLSSKNSRDVYARLVSSWDPIDSLMSDQPNRPNPTVFEKPWDKKISDIQMMMYLDSVTYLPDDILTKVDRASMAVSLEARVPILDHRVFEFAWRLPQSMKIRGGKGKWILKNLLSKYVPRELFERPKMGFGVPIDSWLRGPLKEWANDLLSDKNISQQGFFNPSPIRVAWNEHLSGKRNQHYRLWTILMFQQWMAHENKI